MKDRLAQKHPLKTPVSLSIGAAQQVTDNLPFGLHHQGRAGLQIGIIPGKKINKEIVLRKYGFNTLPQKPGGRANLPYSPAILRTVAPDNTGVSSCRGWRLINRS